LEYAWHPKYAKKRLILDIIASRQIDTKIGLRQIKNKNMGENKPKNKQINRNKIKQNKILSSAFLELRSGMDRRYFLG